MCKESVQRAACDCRELSEWKQCFQDLQVLKGDPDVVAYNPQKKRLIVAEVEGESSGQPEQKLYKAIGQMVRTVSQLPQGWNSRTVIVVYGDKIAAHLQCARALAKLGISGVAIADDVRNDRWLLGEPLHAGDQPDKD